MQGESSQLSTAMAVFLKGVVVLVQGLRFQAWRSESRVGGAVWAKTIRTMEYQMEKSLLFRIPQKGTILVTTFNLLIDWCSGPFPKP